MRVGFIGLGNMGSGMARNLIRAGHQLTVYNRTRQRAESLESLGARVVSSPAEAASAAEVLITMLADDGAVEQALLGHDGATGALPPGAVHVGMSTISVQLSRRLVAEHRAKQQHYIAAPVFGRPDAAAAGKLFIVAAGPSQQIERCRGLFDRMGQKTFVIDEQPPAANVFKLTGNFLITTVLESLAEAFALVRKSGLDAGKFLEVMTESLFSTLIPKLRQHDRVRQVRARGIQNATRIQGQPTGAGRCGRGSSANAHGKPGPRPVFRGDGPGIEQCRLVSDLPRFTSKCRTLGNDFCEATRPTSLRPAWERHSGFVLPGRCRQRVVWSVETGGRLRAEQAAVGARGRKAHLASRPCICSPPAAPCTANRQGRSK
jgi:3-hydroxyisobutyrate dehydrogenase-like beta-hydroxyacid dehydrogenase